MRTAAGVRRRAGVALLAAVLALVPAVAGWPAAPSHAADHPQLYLVTLRGPGTAGHQGEAAPRIVAGRMLARQAAVLTAVDAPPPVYQWTTALNGFAVELTADQAATLAGDDRVAHVERNQVRRLAATASVPETSRRSTLAPGLRGTAPHGAGTVVGFVDTGIDPTSRAFSRIATLGPPPARFRGGCDDAPEDSAWAATDCTTKVVGARFFVAGFGADRLRSTAALSPRDTDGHGTEMASIAAGTDEVPVRVGRQRLGRFSGVAPRARVAAYKACWAAPDPADDGCATADLVAAIDRATADRVDVLNVSVGGPSASIDTVERALLGATEAGVVVTAAAGNEGRRAYAAHPAPWVVTVGATVAAERVGAVVLRRGRTLTGAMAAPTAVGPARLVVGAEAVASGARRAAARVCAPGSLDARKVAGAVVLCRRGEVARVEKSAAVRLADGAGMVLANTGPGSLDADLHAVPTVHVSVRDGRALVRWAARTARPVVRLVPRGWSRGPDRVARFSSGGDPTWSVLKPDLVAPGTSVLAATAGGWEVVSGTSVATAHVSGVAALLLGRRGATPAEVRSALLTTTAPANGEPGLASGVGRLRVRPMPRLAYLTDPRAYRAWLNGRRTRLDLPQAVLRHGRLAVRRTITNTGRRPLWLTGHLRGFETPVRLSPSAALLRPGRRLTFRISLPAGQTATDRGAVVWRSADGDATRLTVVVTR